MWKYFIGMAAAFKRNNLQSGCKGIFHVMLEIVVYDKKNTNVIFNWSNEIFLYGFKFDVIDCVVFHMNAKHIN